MTDPHLYFTRPVVPNHLRLWLRCGHIGCCDSSLNSHARKDFEAESHPVLRCFEPVEDWRWYYVNERQV